MQPIWIIEHSGRSHQVGFGGNGEGARGADRRHDRRDTEDKPDPDSPRSRFIDELLQKKRKKAA